MDVRTARLRGYTVYTGMYENSIGLIKEKQAELKKKGYKTVIVPSKASGYERSAGVKKGMTLGYSLYAEPKYGKDRERQRLNESLSRLPRERELLVSEHSKQLAELDAQEKDLIERLRVLESTNPKTPAIRKQIARIRSRLHRIHNPGAAWHRNERDKYDTRYKEFRDKGNLRRAKDMEERAFAHHESVQKSLDLGMSNPTKKSIVPWLVIGGLAFWWWKSKNKGA